MFVKETLQQPAKGQQDSQTGARRQASAKAAYIRKSVLFKPRFQHMAASHRDATFIKSDN